MPLPDLQSWANLRQSRRNRLFRRRRRQVRHFRCDRVQGIATPRSAHRRAPDPPHFAPLRADRNRPGVGGARRPHPRRERGSRGGSAGQIGGAARPRPTGSADVVRAASRSAGTARLPCRLSRGFGRPATRRRIVDLVAQGIDIAVRIADLPDSSLVARRLCPVRRWVVGAPAYFARHGTRSGRATSNAMPVSATATSPPASGGISRTRRVSKRRSQSGGPLSATNAEALEGALLAGIGIALQPDFHRLGGAARRPSGCRARWLEPAAGGAQCPDAAGAARAPPASPFCWIS